MVGIALDGRAKLHLCRIIYLLGLVAVAAGSGCNTVATAHNMQGARLYEQGQYYAAMEKFQKSMANNPGDANAYYNLASTMHQLAATQNDPGLLTQAEALYNQCLDRNPNHPECHRALAVLLVQTDRSDRAFTLMKNWAMRSPQNADARVELARLYQEFGDSRTAELQLQQALQLDQHNTRAWTAMAHLRESKGDVQQALANYQRAYVLNGYDPALAQRIATLNQTAGPTVTAPLSDGGTRTVDNASPQARY